MQNAPNIQITLSPVDGWGWLERQWSQHSRCLLSTGYLSPSEIIRQHDERRLAESNRASMSIIGGCRASKSFHNFYRETGIDLESILSDNNKDNHE